MVPYTLKVQVKKSNFLMLFELISEIGKLIKSPSSYSQTGEDTIAMRYLTSDRGYYIDVGAGRPLSGSNTYALYRKGWSGLCIDPITTNKRLFRTFRSRDIFLQVLIGESRTEIDFFEFYPYAYSTAVSSIAQKHLQNPGIVLLRQSKLQVHQLSSFLPQLDDSVETFLSIDVEGFDLMVLKSNNWNVFKPKLICIEEWSNLNGGIETEISRYLIGHGYELVDRTRLSTFFRLKSQL